MRIFKHYSLTRIEGSASLELHLKDGEVLDAKVCIYDYRGIERVLVGRPYMDALVINPRVCGICGHAHLKATVEALENALNIKPTRKAKIVREITSVAEILQNHIKWFYLHLMPDFVIKKENLAHLYEPFKGKRWKAAVEFANVFVKINALFSGQWPHSSYMVPGGVTCHVDEYTLLRSIELLHKGKSYMDMLEEDIDSFKRLCTEFQLETIGRAYMSFLGNCNVWYKEKQEIVRPEQIEEKDEYSYKSKNPSAYSWSSAVRYMGRPYEVGPLARAMNRKDKLVLSLVRVYQDSFLVRVLARLYEIFSFIGRLEELHVKLSKCLHKPSWLQRKTGSKSGVGYALVEAARGTLFHRVWIESGTIRDYKIITPSSWNLGPRCDRYMGVAEKALLTAKDEWSANLILRSFDVCSVCATH